MASHDSALKAHRQNVKRREHNRQLRTRLRSALRDIRAAIDSEDPAKVKDALRDTISLVDKMAAKKLIHRNTAGRYKSRLASRVAKKSAAAYFDDQPLEQHARIASRAFQLDIRAKQRLNGRRYPPRVRGRQPCRVLHADH